MSLAEANNDENGAEGAGGVADEAAATGTPGAEIVPNEGEGATPGADLDWGEAYKGEDGQLDLAKVNERLKAADAAPEGVPENVDGYDLALSEKIEISEGNPIEFSKDDPLVAEFLKEAHAAGKSQEQVSAELGMAAKVLQANFAARDAATKEAVAAEAEKIGVDRLKAAHASLSALTSNDDADKIFENISTSAAFDAVERLLTKANGGGGGRTPAGNGESKEPASLADRLFGKKS